jgi:hypothetical protein
MIKYIDNRAIIMSGRIFRTAKVRDEPYECIDEPKSFIDKLKGANIAADLFTFMQEISDPEPRYPFHCEPESLAVLPITTYDQWWQKQINDKTRNMVRKSRKGGVELRLVDFDDDLVTGIVEIYNEAPTRQGKPFKHYGKDFDTIKRDHETFLEKSDFIGAFHEGKLIGFAKLVHERNASSLMQIIARISYRDRAPTNALIARSVELCAERKIPFLHYGSWSTGGLGLFKKNHAFLRVQIPRYFVPLNFKGRMMIWLNLHRHLSDYLPEIWRNRIALCRRKWYSCRVGKKGSKGAVAQLVEHRS